MDDKNPENRALRELEQNTRVLRPPQCYLYSAIISLLFFTIVIFGIASLAANKEPSDQPAYVFMTAALFWLIPCSISIWSIQVYRNVSLMIQNGKLLMQGVLSRKELSLQEVSELRWDLEYLHLTAPNTSITIRLDFFNSHDLIWLISYFRRELPQSSQQNWDIFCLRKAMPLRERLQTNLRAPGPGEILITRKRYDWTGLTLIVLMTPPVIYYSFKVNQFAYLTLPAFLIGFWLLLRYSTPPQGKIEKQLCTQKEFVHFLFQLLVWGTPGLILFLFLINSNFSESVKIIGTFCLIMTWLELLLWRPGAFNILEQEKRKLAIQKRITEFEADLSSQIIREKGN